MGHRTPPPRTGPGEVPCVAGPVPTENLLIPGGRSGDPNPAGARPRRGQNRPPEPRSEGRRKACPRGPAGTV